MAAIPLVPGDLRQEQGEVNLGSAKFFDLPMIDEQKEQVFLRKTLADSQTTTTDKTLAIMDSNMHQRIFWGGNKQTATLSANKVMIDGGAGL